MSAPSTASPALTSPPRPIRTATARAVAAAAVLVVAVTGCGAPPSRTVAGPIDKAGGAITVWMGPSALHPHEADADLVAALHAPLVAVHPGTRLPSWGPDAPAALLAAIRSPDLRRWELELKPGWRWHDGSEVTAADLARGLDAARAAGLAATSTITDVQVVDKVTLALALTGPYGQLPALLADPAFLPLPAVATSSPAVFAATPVGTGPYRLARREGDRLRLRAVDGHPSGPAATDTVEVSLAPDPSPVDDVLLGADGGPTPQAAGRGQTLARFPGRQMAYVGLPLTDTRFADPDTRLALSLAVDREALADGVLDGAVVPADRFLGPGMARDEEGEDVCRACAHAPDRAARLWPQDFDGPLTIWFAADAGHEQVVDFLAESWRRVLGVEEIELASLPAEGLLDMLRQAEVTGPFRLTWAADLPSPSRLLQPLFGRRGIGNDARYRGAEAAAALDAADIERDLSAALDAYADAESLIGADMPVVPLWFSTIPVVADEDLAVDLDGMGRLIWTDLRRR